MTHPFARLTAVLHFSVLTLMACLAHADPVDVQLAGQPSKASRASSLMAPTQNIYARSHVSLDGRWSYIIDPY